MRYITLIGLATYIITTILAYSTILKLYKYKGVGKTLHIIRTVSLSGAFISLIVYRLTGSEIVAGAPTGRIALYGILLLLLAESVFSIVKGDWYHAKKTDDMCDVGDNDDACGMQGK